MDERDMCEQAFKNGYEQGKPKWIPVTERLPEKMGKYVCIYVFGENADYPFEQVLWYYPQLEKPHFQHEGSMGMRVTHWMPLPEPPKGE